MTKPPLTDLLARARASLQKADDAITNQILLSDQIILLAATIADMLAALEATK